MSLPEVVAGWQMLTDGEKDEIVARMKARRDELEDVNKRTSLQIAADVNSTTKRINDLVCFAHLFDQLECC